MHFGHSLGSSGLRGYHLWSHLRQATWEIVSVVMAAMIHMCECLVKLKE